MREIELLLWLFNKRQIPHKCVDMIQEDRSVSASGQLTIEGAFYMQKYTNAVPKTRGEHKTVAEHLLLSFPIIIN